MLSDRVDSDFASDIESRKSVTGYLLSPHGGPMSWNVARQGDVTLSCSEAAAKLNLLLRARRAKRFYTCMLFSKGLHARGRPPGLWVDNVSVSCILMSENPNRERSRHIDVRSFLAGNGAGRCCETNQMPTHTERS